MRTLCCEIFKIIFLDVSGMLTSDCRSAGNSQMCKNLRSAREICNRRPLTEPANGSAGKRWGQYRVNKTGCRDQRRPMGVPEKGEGKLGLTKSVRSITVHCTKNNLNRRLKTVPVTAQYWNYTNHRLNVLLGSVWSSSWLNEQSKVYCTRTWFWNCINNTVFYSTNNIYRYFITTQH